MCSRIWFELPDLEATKPHVTTKVAQNTYQTSARYGLQKLDKAVKFLDKAENELRGEFFLPQIWFKIWLLKSIDMQI